VCPPGCRTATRCETTLTKRSASGGRVYLAIGAVTGLAGGLFGVGGGFMLMPLQVMWARVGARRASGTSLAAIIPMAVVGAAVYYLGKNGAHQVDLAVAFFLVLGGMAGAYVGAWVAPHVPKHTLHIVLSVLLVMAGLRELLGIIPGGSASVHGTGAVISTLGYMLIVLAGFVIGIVSGITGVGGGIFLVPAMVTGFGIAQRVAQGTSLVAILPTVAVGAFAHYRRGNVDLGAALSMGLAGMPAALIGALAALWLPQSILAGLFGLMLLAAAVPMWPKRVKLAPIRELPLQSMEAHK